MARASAGKRVKRNDAVTVDEGRSPFFQQTARDHLASFLVPVFRLRGFAPTFGIAGCTFWGVGRRWRMVGRIAGAKDVQGLQARRAFGPRGTTGILQRATELALVEVFRAPKGEDAHVEGRVDNELVAQLGRHRKAVEDEGLDIGEEVVASEIGKNAS